MTADHAGQTGGERDPEELARSLTATQELVMDVLAARTRLGEQLWTFTTKVRPAVRKLAELGLVREMHGITDHTIRASLTDAGRELWMLPDWAPCWCDAGSQGRDQLPPGPQHDDDCRRFRPVPVPGQAAREATVEAVARELHRAWGNGGLAWDAPGGWQASWRASAERVLSLPAVAALSAAPGQEPAHEWNCPSCGATTRARMADHSGEEQEREDAAVDALMWAALTVEHSPGIKHQAKAVTAIRDRAAALRATPGQEQP